MFFVQFDHATILKKKNGFHNCFCKFLLDFLAHSFPFPTENALNFITLP